MFAWTFASLMQEYIIKAPNLKVFQGLGYQFSKSGTFKVNANSGWIWCSSVVDQLAHTYFELLLRSFSLTVCMLFAAILTFHAHPPTWLTEILCTVKAINVLFLLVVCPGDFHLCHSWRKQALRHISFHFFLVHLVVCNTWSSPSIECAGKCSVICCGPVNQRIVDKGF